MIRRALFALMLLLAAPALTESAKQQVAVAAAANLKTAAEELKQGFEAEHPGVDVGLTFGASGTFFAQIQNGAPFDLFLSADRAFPEKLIAAKLGIAADEKVYAFGKLVAWLPAGATIDLEKRGLAALADLGVKKIAIANPTAAPFGRATEEALKSAQVYDAVKDKLVLGTSVGQVAQFATTGAVDVAFLPYSLAFGKELAGGHIYLVPETLYPRIEQSGLVLSTSKQPALARALLMFLTGPKGRAILSKYGYGLP